MNFKLDEDIQFLKRNVRDFVQNEVEKVSMQIVLSLKKIFLASMWVRLRKKWIAKVPAENVLSGEGEGYVNAMKILTKWARKTNGKKFRFMSEIT